MSTLNLKDEVRAMLAARRGQWVRIAADADVSYSWLVKFANGSTNNPGFDTLMAVREVLLRPVAR